MSQTQLTPEQLEDVQTFQKNEITEYHIYQRLARRVKNDNAAVLKNIAEDELKHYHFWKKYSGKEVKPNRWKVFKFYWITRLMGLTFGIKLMENGEAGAQEKYNEALDYIPEAKSIVEDEDQHEEELIGMIREKSLDYVGSIVLGLNDALVELTGALAGMTLALQNTRLIATAGLITGIAASFSMGASEYLSNKSEGNHQKALPSALYTGVAYIITVFVLIMPYLLVDNYFVCLAMTLALAILIIFFFNYYISVAKDLKFKKRFLEMAILSLGVAALTFGISYFVRMFFGVEV
ncbi:MAG TPA: VIT1/CCC1 transporter family protein [Bacteroidales bacterium]|nr:VIT1/CCC1 transporter family protein [Bacteroidales bacterium]